MTVMLLLVLWILWCNVYNEYNVEQHDESFVDQWKCAINHYIMPFDDHYFMWIFFSVPGSNKEKKKRKKKSGENGKFKILKFQNLLAIRKTDERWNYWCLTQI